MLRFPVDVSDTINAMKTSLSEALESKVEELDNDVKQALMKGDYLTIDLIFQEVKLAKDADSYFINNSTYNRLIGILEDFLNEMVDSIKAHYMVFDIAKAHSKQEHLWKLEKVRELFV